MAKYPTQVPILSYRDFLCDASGCSTKKKHCIVEWINTVFAPRAVARMAAEGEFDDYDNRLPEGPPRVYTVMLATAQEVAKENKLHTDLTHMWSDVSKLITLNDNFLRPKHLAETWNRTMEKLGYTELTSA